MPTETECVRVGVIGGGVAGSSVVYALHDSLLSGRVCLTIFEMGRTFGGRATTRHSRQGLRQPMGFEEITVSDPGLYFDHGAPEVEASAPPFQALCASLASHGVLTRIDETQLADYFGTITSEGTFERAPGDPRCLRTPSLLSISPPPTPPSTPLWDDHL